MNRTFPIALSKALAVALTSLVAPGLATRSLEAAAGDENWEVMSAQLPGVDGSIDAFATSGDRLYAGGRFRVIAGLVTSGVASWDGTRWSALGGGVNGGVGALLVKGSDLIAGGDFTTAGSAAATNIARWDGTRWSALGSLASRAGGTVLALEEFGGEIYAGGTFKSESNGAAADHLVRWNGSAWLPVGAGVDGAVFALHSFDGALYAGGVFKTAGGLFANGIARWDGDQWETLDQGVRGGQGIVSAISSVSTNLYVGGDFLQVGTLPGTSARGLARWFKDDSNDESKGEWRSLNVQPVSVFALHGFDDRLIVGGRFPAIGTATSRNVAELTKDEDWISFGTGVSADNASDVRAIEHFGGQIFCGGFFQKANDQFIASIARWTGSAWASVGGGRDLGLSDQAFQVRVVGSRVYVFGIFTTAGGARVGGSAEWTGAGWLRMGDGVPEWTQFQRSYTATDGSDLFVTMSGTRSTRFAQRWDGASWSTVGGTGVQGPVATSGTNLYVAGTFAQGNGVATLENGEWKPLGEAFTRNAGPVALPIAHMIAQGTNVYVGGSFDKIGADDIRQLAHWDGLKWQKLGASTPITAGIGTLAIVGNRLYVGPFGNAGSNPIHIWDGTTWSSLPGSFISTNRIVAVSSIVPDGSDLWVAGQFDQIDGLTANGIARWDGTRWHALGSGIMGSVSSLGLSSDELYVAGNFTTAGGQASRYFAIWHKAPSEVEIIVNSTADLPQDPAITCCCDTGRKLADGVTAECTLRAAIEFANRNAGKDTISFAIPSDDPGFAGGVPLIQPRRGLPLITEAVTIDGWSQNRGLATPPIELNGALIPGPDPSTENENPWEWKAHPQAAHGLQIRTDNCRINGLVINQFPLFGVFLEGDGNVIQGNFIGTDRAGLQAKANGVVVSEESSTESLYGIRGGSIYGKGARNLIGGAGRAGNLVSGLDNGYRTIRGPGRMLSGAGIDITGNVNVISGNWVGTDATGLHPIGGVSPAQQLSLYPAISVTGTLNLIGGSTADAGNVVISGAAGVFVSGDFNQLTRNWVGVGRDGKGFFPASASSSERTSANYRAGIEVSEGSGNEIGGAGSLGNVIGCSGAGLVVGVNGPAPRTRIEGNLIGVEGNGVSPAENGNAGIRIIGTSNDSSVISNTVAYAQGNGIHIESSGNGAVSGLQIVSQQDFPKRLFSG